MERFYGRLPGDWSCPIMTIIARYTTEFMRHYEQTSIIRMHKCEYKDCNYIGSTAIHHIIPLSEGGAHRKKNFIELCPSCHKRVEVGIYEIYNPGIYNYRLLRKYRKIMRKFYKSLTGEEYYKLPQSDFILKHIETNDNIKYFIRMNLLERLKEYCLEKNISFKHY